MAKYPSNILNSSEFKLPNMKTTLYLLSFIRCDQYLAKLLIFHFSIKVEKKINADDNLVNYKQFWFCQSIGIYLE